MRWGDDRGLKAIAPPCLVALGLLVLALAFFSATVHSAPSSDLQAAPVATIPPPDVTDTWENLEIYGAQVSAIAIAPGSNPPTGTVYAGTTSGSGLHRSTDGGLTWESVYIKATGGQD